MWWTHLFTALRPRNARRLALPPAVAALISAVLILTPARAHAQIIDVPSGGNLQQALNSVQPGGTIRLASGATFVGSFKLPAKGGSAYILITTNTALPPAGTRIDPSYKTRLATIRSDTTISALVTAAGASYYRIVGVAFEANKNGAGDVIALGRSDQTTLSAVPHHIELDRVLITGHPTLGQKRAISVNAEHVSIINSDIRDIKAAAQESQAICGWNTRGPILIRNNYLEAAGENIMFGGAGIAIPNVVPSDITIEDNFLTKNPAWRGTSWTVKNLFELKNAQRVLVRHNIMQFNWSDGQVGFAIVLTPRNSNGKNPWVIVDNVQFIENVLAHSGSGFNILGFDNTAPSRQCAHVTIRDNLILDISGKNWGGVGTFVQMGGEPAYITIDHNTVLHSGNAVLFYSGVYMNSSNVQVPGGPIKGFVFTNNLMHYNIYGLLGDGKGNGNVGLAYYAPGAVVQRNVMASDKDQSSKYPPDNQFPTLAAYNANFVNAAAGDFRLLAGSAYRGASLDGRDLGANFGVLPAQAPPAPPNNIHVGQ